MGTEVNVNNKNNGGSVIAIVILCLLIGVSGYFAYKYRTKYKEQKTISQQLSNSINNLQDTAKAYKIKWNDGQKTSAATISALYLTNSNLEQLYKDKLEAAYKMGAKNNKIQSISTASTIVHDTISTVAVIVTGKQIGRAHV